MVRQSVNYNSRSIWYFVPGFMAAIGAALFYPSYWWIAVLISSVPVAMYLVRKGRQLWREIQAQALWLEEDFIP